MLYKQETIIAVTISQIAPVLNRRMLPRTNGNFFVIKFRLEMLMIWIKIIGFLYSGKESVNVYQWPDLKLLFKKMRRIMMLSSENRNRFLYFKHESNLLKTLQLARLYENIRRERIQDPVALRRHANPRVRIFWIFKSRTRRGADLDKNFGKLQKTDYFARVELS